MLRRRSDGAHGRDPGAIPPALEIVGCPACHTTDAEFVQTTAQRTFSPFYDAELDARGERLGRQAGGLDVPVPPFGPLQQARGNLTRRAVREHDSPKDARTMPGLGTPRAGMPDAAESPMLNATDTLGGRVGILDTLTHEHRELSLLVDRLVQSAHHGDEESSRELLSLVQRHFVLHRQCEEIEFYSLLSEIERCRAWVNQSRATHEEILDTLVELFSSSVHDLGWTTLVMCLRDAIHDHIDHEEGQLFAMAQDMLSPHALRGLDAQYSQRKQIVSALLDAVHPRVASNEALQL